MIWEKPERMTCPRGKLEDGVGGTDAPWIDTKVLAAGRMIGFTVVEEGVEPGIHCVSGLLTRGG